MSPITLFSGLSGINGANNAAFGIQSNNEARMGLANRAAANYNNPRFLGQIAQADTQLEMKNNLNASMYEAHSLMAEAARKRQKQETARRQQAISSGLSVFA